MSDVERSVIILSRVSTYDVTYRLYLMEKKCPSHTPSAISPNDCRLVRRWSAASQLQISRLVSLHTTSFYQITVDSTTIKEMHRIYRTDSSHYVKRHWLRKLRKYTAFRRLVPSVLTTAFVYVH